MTITPLGWDERARDLPALAASGWRGIEGRDAIRKIWVFASFSEAFGFMTRCALAAEKADHHPEWSNTWATVDVTLATHDCDGLSARDVALARIFDALGTDARKIRDDHGVELEAPDL
ncbi:4a-hydroxytetrahydrobiopterin dehydratase [Frigidibacter sp. MR17.24]|uniref:4a-hydroxytetrahydrobiopterin dehydratase n=1 Tax=Frigidibacter sp. MR17.24 TaxID=3127345 RepID=UPI00301311F9